VTPEASAESEKRAAARFSLAAALFVDRSATTLPHLLYAPSMQSHDHVPIPQQSGAKPNRRLCIWARASFVIALVILGTGAGAWMHAQAQTVIQNSQLEKADSFASSDDTLGNAAGTRIPSTSSARRRHR
jgi:hypothetical protein